LRKAGVTDDEMAIIGGFTDLEFLQLDGSNVTDHGFPMSIDESLSEINGAFPFHRLETTGKAMPPSYP
jgi:hypothetical protein